MDPNLIDYSQMLGTPPVPQGPPGPVPPPQMLQALSPQPQAPTPTPPANPQELETRKAGWRTLMANPNFARALAYTGQAMSQPMAQGQTTLGHLGQSIGVGTAAFEAGKYRDWEQGQQEEDQASKVAERGAVTARVEAATPGVEAESDVAQATRDAKIATINTEADAAATRLKTAKTKQEVEAIQAEIDKKRLAIEQEIPDAKLRAAAMAKVDAAALAGREALARLTQTEAGGKKTAAEATQQEITTDVLKSMDKQEQKEFLTKTGRYNTHISSASTTRDMYGSLYDSLKASAPDDARIKNKSKEQFVLDGMTSQKSLDATTALKNYMTAVGQANIDPDPEIVSALSDQIKTGAKAKAGTAAPRAGKPQVEEWVRDSKGNLVRKSQIAPAK